MSRPFAADDFPAIRARLSELRREQHDASGDPSTDDSSRATNGLHRHAVEVASRQSNDTSELLPMQQTLLRRLKAGAV